MGGYNSGRRKRFADKIDSMHQISLAYLRQLGALEPNRQGTLTWSRRGDVTAKVGYVMHTDCMVLHYSVRENADGEWISIRERFPFDFTDQPFGGKRRWFTCLGCGRRCSVLYGGKYFRCRKCHRLVYDSQYEPFPVGFINRTDAVRKRLGGQAGYCYPFPPRPKGMHHRTYERLFHADWDAQMRLDAMLNEGLT